MGYVMIKGYKCFRCGHEWVPLKIKHMYKVPVACPRCHNTSWDKKPKLKYKNKSYAQ